MRAMVNRAGALVEREGNLQVAVHAVPVDLMSTHARAAQDEGRHDDPLVRGA